MFRSDRKAMSLWARAKAFARAIDRGFRPWQPGQIILMSDRQYEVQRNGEWHRQELAVEKRGWWRRMLAA